MFNKCPACRGAKQVMGLGYMIRNCRTCHGVGHIEKNNDPIVEVVITDSKPIIDVPKKPRGRPVKAK